MTNQQALFDLRPLVKPCNRCRISVAIEGDYGFYCPTCGTYHPDKTTALMGEFVHFDDSIRRAYFARADSTEATALSHLREL